MSSPSVERLRWLAHLFDSAVRIPGTNKRIGIDAILGLFPGVGDLLSGAFSLYIVYAAAQQGVSRGTLLKMMSTVAIDVVLGSFPLVGDVFDVVFKANTKNIDLLQNSLIKDSNLQNTSTTTTAPLLSTDAGASQKRSHSRVIRIFIVIFLLLFFVFLSGVVFLLALIFHQSP